MWGGALWGPQLLQTECCSPECYGLCALGRPVRASLLVWTWLRQEVVEKGSLADAVAAPFADSCQPPWSLCRCWALKGCLLRAGRQG